MSLQKILIIIALVAILASLFSALRYMIKDQGEGTRTVQALTWRVSLSLALLGLIALGYGTGVLQPGA